jgi:hypothetical protein
VRPSTPPRGVATASTSGPPRRPAVPEATAPPGRTLPELFLLGLMLPRVWHAPARRHRVPTVPSAGRSPCTRCRDCAPFFSSPLASRRRRLSHLLLVAL